MSKPDGAMEFCLIDSTGPWEPMMSVTLDECPHAGELVWAGSDEAFEDQVWKVENIMHVPSDGVRKGLRYLIVSPFDVSACGCAGQNVADKLTKILAELRRTADSLSLSKDSDRKLNGICNDLSEILVSCQSMEESLKEMTEPYTE